VKNRKFSIIGFSYRHFSWLANFFSHTVYNEKYVSLEKNIEIAGYKIYPDAYKSLIGFITIIATIIAIPIVIITGIIFFILSPLLPLLLGYAIPRVQAQDRASKLDVEVPFAGTYISVMATGGLSPYTSLKRLKNCNLLPNISNAVKEIEVNVQLKGMDPVSAIEKSAENLPSREYKDLMQGYAHTLRTGGDVIHYLLIRTETMFRDLGTKIRAYGERTAVLMESYIAVIILTTLSFSIMFMTSIAFESFWKGIFSAETYLLYSYLLVPAISLAFIYLTDLSSLNEPEYEKGPYKVFAVSLPIMIILMLTMFLPFITRTSPPYARPFMDFIVYLRTSLGLEKGFEAAIGLAVALLVGTLPGAYAHSYYMRRGKDVVHDVTTFLRDLTETRKTGASPESCIENLAERHYGKFDKSLKVAARQIRWGLPFKVIYDTFREKIRAWLALINIYLLVDAIEVGGGSPETLDTLTRFSEMLSSIEKEKKSILRPLVIMPYIGAGILLFSTMIFLAFMQFVLKSFARQAIQYSQFLTLLLPPLVLQAYLTGLVTGKMSSGVLSTGFKHATVLVIMALIIMLLIKYVSIPFSFG
jgi:flagellar protein FlaJ